MSSVVRSSKPSKSFRAAVTTTMQGESLPATMAPVAAAPEVPAYLQDVYYWAYINPRHVKYLDNDFVVRTILWQQHNKLQRLAFDEIEPGQRVLQSACVYGSFSANLTKHIGPTGTMDVFDVANIQVVNTRKKLAAFPNATVHYGNVLQMDLDPFDTICCYFLLHEIPEKEKHEAVNLFLNKVVPGGKVVFIDYHKPRWWHPLKLITSIIFDTLEPFAKGLWRKEIREFAHTPEEFTWHKKTIFGGLFQKVVAVRRRPT
jgi:ubiquinone/menaquinone biosynthesis C-methylase UbiE